MKKIILLISILLLCSCYDYKELNNVDIVDNIRIDYDDNYVVYFHVLDSDQYIKEYGNNIDIIFSNMNNKLLLEHVDTIYLSSSVCKNGIKNILEYFIRQIDFSNNYKIVISNDINNIDSEIIGLDNIKLLNILLDDNSDIGLINIDNNMLGYFNDDKLVNYIDSDIYKFIMFNSNYIVSDNDNVINIYDRDYKYKNNILDITCYGEITNTSYNINNYDLLSNKFKIIIENNIYKYINDTLDNDSNLFGVKDGFKVNVNLIINKNGNLLEGLDE